MAKIYPCRPSFSSSSASASASDPTSSSSCSDEQETFTILMKSLVLNSNGYTVYDSNGKVVYRIDNYDTKCSSEVYLMDLKGNVLCTILRKNLLRFGLWDCHRSNGTRRPWFRVRKGFKFCKRVSSYDVSVASDESQSSSSSYYKVKGSFCKSEFKITDNEGRVVSEIRRKQSKSGVVLGEDVVSLTVEAHVDHVFIMALVAIQGLISHKM